MMRALVCSAVAVMASVAAAQEGVLAEADGKQWYKGVTHFHTLWSDGDAAPEKAVKWYADRDYDFISISDHNILQVGTRWFPITTEGDGRLTPDKVAGLREEFGEDWVETRERAGRPQMRLKNLEELKAHFETPEFLIIPGEEVTAAMAVHINAINIAETIRPVSGETPADILMLNLEAIEAHAEKHGLDTLAHINHPNFSTAITAEEIIAMGGERFFEVYNGHGGVRNWGDEALHIVSTDRLWDIVLTVRLSEDPSLERPLLGVATDDAHDWYWRGVGGSIPGRGWVMVLTDELVAGALINAMRAGDFYCTSGVTLERIEANSERYALSIAAEPGVAYTTQFIGSMNGVDIASEPIVDESGQEIRATRRYSPEVGKVLAEVQGSQPVYEMTGGEMYVRAKVISSKLKENPFKEGDYETAWTQPIVLTAK